MLEEIPVRDFSREDEVAIGALVELEFNRASRWYFVSTTAGGTMLNIEGRAILVISVFSPIGDAILGLKVGDEAELESQGQTRVYKVKSLA
jgi:transcription elongation GreA/GreB family factor